MLQLCQGVTVRMSRHLLCPATSMFNLIRPRYVLISICQLWLFFAQWKGWVPGNYPGASTFGSQSLDWILPTWLAQEWAPSVVHPKEQAPVTLTYQWKEKRRGVVKKRAAQNSLQTALVENPDAAHQNTRHTNNTVNYCIHVCASWQTADHRHCFTEPWCSLLLHENVFINYLIIYNSNNYYCNNLL